MRNATKTTDALDEFAGRAADMALRGAVNALVPAGTRPGWTDAEIETLLVVVRAEVVSALPRALADAREAVAARMTQVAEATFAASMTLAGTTAARKWAESRKPKTCCDRPFHEHTVAADETLLCPKGR